MGTPRELLIKLIEGAGYDWTDGYHHDVPMLHIVYNCATDGTEALAYVPVASAQHVADFLRERLAA